MWVGFPQRAAGLKLTFTCSVCVSSYKEEGRNPSESHLLGHGSREEKRLPVSGNHFEDLVNLERTGKKASDM